MLIRRLVNTSGIFSWNARLCVYVENFLASKLRTEVHFKEARRNWREIKGVVSLFVAKECTCTIDVVSILSSIALCGQFMGSEKRNEHQLSRCGHTDQHKYHYCHSTPKTMSSDVSEVLLAANSATGVIDAKPEPESTWSTSKLQRKRKWSVVGWGLCVRGRG